MHSVSRRRLAASILMLSAVPMIACGGNRVVAAPPQAAAPRSDPDPDREARAEREARERADAARRREAEEQARRDAEAAARRDATLAEMVFFDFDRAELRPEAQTVLQRKAEVLRAYGGMRLRIEGHADERGSDEYNIALGSRRALAAKQFLVRLGVDAARLDVMSWGEERPLDRAHDERAWSRNRRAEFVNVAAPMAADR